MKVRLLTGLSGPARTLEAGDNYDCAQAEAQRLIAAGFAVPVAEREIERTIVVPAHETRHRARGRGRT